jgi:hypothetical protein
MREKEFNGERRKKKGGKRKLLKVVNIIIVGLG